jgi:hypothetical protein
MSRVRVVGVVLAALFAVSVVVVSSASAVTFLLAGLLTTGGTNLGEVELNTSGEMLLADLNVPLAGEVMELCSNILMGVNLGATEPSHVLITSVLSLSGGNSPLTCEGQTPFFCSGATAATFSPLNLPWLVEFELMIEGTEELFVGLLTKDTEPTKGPGWSVSCSGITDECTAEEGIFNVANEAAGLEDSFSTALTELAGLKLGNCKEGGAESWTVEGTGITTIEGSTGTPTISSIE